MVSRKLETKQSQVLEFDWFKTGHSAVLAVLSLRSRLRQSANPGVNLRGWKPNGTFRKAATETLTDWKNWDALALFALGNSKGAQNDGDQSDDCDRTGAQNSSVAKRTEKDSTSIEQS